MITTQINKINERIAEIYSLPLDDFIASMYMAEMEALIEQKMRLEMLITPRVDRRVSDMYVSCTKKMDTFNLALNFN